MPSPQNQPKAISPQPWWRSYPSALLYPCAIGLTFLMLTLGPPRSPVAPLGLSSLPAASTGANAAAMLNEWDPEVRIPEISVGTGKPLPPSTLEQEKNQNLGVKEGAVKNSAASVSGGVKSHDHRTSRTLEMARWILLLATGYAALLSVIGRRWVQAAGLFFRQSVQEQAGGSDWRLRMRGWMADHQNAAAWFVVLGAVFDGAENLILLRMLNLWQGLENTRLAPLDICAQSASIAFILKIVFYSGALAYILYGWAVSTAYARFRANINGAMEALRTVQVCLAAALLAAIVVLIPGQSLEALRVLFEDTSLSLHRDLVNDATRGYYLVNFWAATFRVVIFLVGAVTLALTTAYWARNLLYLLLPEEIDDPPAQRWARRWLPRTCAILILTSVAVALWRATMPLYMSVSGDYVGREGPETRFHMLLCAVALLFVAGGIIAQAFFKGGRFQREVHPISRDTKRHRPDGMRQQRQVSDLGTRERTILVASTTVYAILTLWLWATRFQFAANFGPMAILLFALSGLVPLLAALSYLGNNIKAPLTSILLLVAFLFSYYDLHDNHRIRDLPRVKPNTASAASATSATSAASPDPTATFTDNSGGGDDVGVAQAIRSDQTSLGQTFTTWLRNRPDKDTYLQAKRPYPVVLVCAEGGGIRAAFQSGMALALLQDKNPSFRTHLFAISGVSGGSVGAATFAALAAKAETVETEEIPRNWWANSTNEILSSDFLSPTVAGFLFGETWQSIIPVPISHVDRARAIEIALENAWDASKNVQAVGNNARISASPSSRNVSSDNPFALSFYALGKDFASRSVPALLLNTTRQETGDRMIVSTIPLSPTQSRKTKQNGDRGIINLVTLADENPDVRPPLSTAAFLSARFSYVTPSGYVRIYKKMTVPKAAAPVASAGSTSTGAAVSAPTTGPIETKAGAGDIKSVYIGKKRYVDGGYFENSGAATLTDVFDMIKNSDHVGRNLPQTDPKWRPPYRIIVLRIGYSYEPEATGEIQFPAQGLNELLAPPAALFKARDGRARVAVALLQSRIESQRDSEARLLQEMKGDEGKKPVDYSEFVDLRFHEGKVPLPLGWLLSSAARNELTNQMEQLTLTIQPPPSLASKKEPDRQELAIDFVIRAVALPDVPPAVAIATNTAKPRQETPRQVAAAPPPSPRRRVRRKPNLGVYPRTAPLRRPSDVGGGGGAGGAGAAPSPLPVPTGEATPQPSPSPARTPSTIAAATPTPSPTTTPPSAVAAGAIVTKGLSGSIARPSGQIPAANATLPPPVQGRPVPLP